MPSTKTMHVTTKSSRLGDRNYKVPPPLRFDSVAGAKKFIKAHKLKVIEHHTHSRGARIQVVDPKGKARTIRIERRKKKEEDSDNQRLRQPGV